jgi:hypothetical protein
MMTANECRQRAQECIDAAQRAREPERVKLLQIADAWIKLANGEAALFPPDPPPSFQVLSPRAANADQ